MLRLPVFPGLTTENIHLRPLTVDDVGKTYLDWFSTPSAAFIASRQGQTLDSLRDFVREKSAKPDTFLLGIFDVSDGAHIGNIKYEPIDLEAREAVMGIFIGASNQQGRGVGREAICATADWLHHACALRQIVLGVDVRNVRARKAYSTVGFAPMPSALIPDTPVVETMVLSLPRQQLSN